MKLKLNEKQKILFQDLFYEATPEEIDNKISDTYNKISDLRAKEPKDNLDQEKIDNQVRGLELDVEKLEKDKIEAEKKVNESVLQEDNTQALIDFFKQDKKVDDDDLHELADGLGIEAHDLEGEIYSIIQTFFNSGLAKEKGVTEKDVDQEELKKGIVIEVEHYDKDNPYANEIAKKIALDHLAELDNYYTLLAALEKKAEE